MLCAEDQRVLTRLIFVSCGQLTAEERNLGQQIKAEVDAVPGFEAYYADAVQSLAGLAEHILDALRRSAGAIVVLHPRGRVLSDRGDDLGVRSSVWINQEVAILAYRQFADRADLPILAFADPSIGLEGAMTAFIVNPKPLTDARSLLPQVREWLLALPVSQSAANVAVFEEKWNALTENDRTLLAALVAEGGHGIKESSVRRRLIDQHGFDRTHADDVVRERRLALSQANLVQLRHNVYDGDEISLHPSWERLVRHEVAKFSHGGA